MDYFTKELIIVIMDAAMNVVLRKIKAEEKALRVLDSMNNAFVNRWNPEDRYKIAASAFSVVSPKMLWYEV